MSDDHWKRLYTDHAADYERLVQCEDYQGHLLAALDRICPLENASVVEFGAGTGRITAQLIPLVGRIWTFSIGAGPISVSRPEQLPGNSSAWSLAGRCWPPWTKSREKRSCRNAPACGGSGCKQQGSLWRCDD